MLKLSKDCGLDGTLIPFYINLFLIFFKFAQKDTYFLTDLYHSIALMVSISLMIICWNKHSLSISMLCNAKNNIEIFKIGIKKKRKITLRIETCIA